LGMQLKMGGKFHLKLNIGERPIANKYKPVFKEYHKKLKQIAPMIYSDPSHQVMRTHISIIQMEGQQRNIL